VSRAGPVLPVYFPPSHLNLTPDSDSDEEDAQFFSVGTSGAPQAPVPEPPSRHSQSTFSTLVTVLKGRITAFCEAKVRHPWVRNVASRRHRWPAVPTTTP
jgi:hypothetical protein